jgi:hypothetical protein
VLGGMMLHRETSYGTIAAAEMEDRIVVEHVKGEDRQGIVFGAVGKLHRSQQSDAVDRDEE